MSDTYEATALFLRQRVLILQARLAEAERDAARYRFIKQWARRLDITGYSLTNNEHFEPRIDEAMAIASQPSSADVERRPCTCHPDDNPPVPCPRMYALQDCRRAAALAADEIESLRSRLADSERLREDERLTWDAQHKRQASMNAHLAALVTDAQEELRKCQQDAIQLQDRLAEAEALLREAIPAVQSYARKHGRAFVAAARRNDAYHAAKHADIEKSAWGLADRIRAYLAPDSATHRETPVT